MMTKDEALKMAIEWADEWKGYSPIKDKVLKACKEALEQPPQEQCEPVAWIYEDELPKNYPYELMFQHSKIDTVRMFPVYAPVVKQDPVAIVHRGIAYWKGKEPPEGTELYTAPPHPQTVKDALEKAAQIVRSASNMLNGANAEAVLVAIANEIDALIEELNT